MIDVSIIIPFYKNVDWLYEAINSIEEKKITFEIIVINDGSSEEIDLKKVKNIKNMKIIYNKNQGAGKSRNEGIEIAKGKYVAFLDSDDVFSENKLFKQIQYMKRNDYKWSHTSYIKFFSDGSQKIVSNKEFVNQIFPACLSYNPIATPTVIIEKSVFIDKENRFAEDTNFGEDGFLWYKISTKYPLGYIDEPLTFVRITKTNANNSVNSHIKFRSKMYLELQEKSFVINNYKIPFDLKFSYWLIFLTNKLKLQEGILIKLAYTLPYIIFKKNKINFKGGFRD